MLPGAREELAHDGGGEEAQREPGLVGMAGLEGAPGPGRGQEHGNHQADRRKRPREGQPPLPRREQARAEDPAEEQHQVQHVHEQRFVAEKAQGGDAGQRPPGGGFDEQEEQQQDAQTNGPRTRISRPRVAPASGHRGPASHWSAITRSWVTAITCRASQAKSAALSTGVAAASVFPREKYGRCRKYPTPRTKSSRRARLRLARSESGARGSPATKPDAKRKPGAVVPWNMG